MIERVGQVGLVWAVVFAAWAVAGPSRADELEEAATDNAAVAIGAAVEDFSLPDIHRRSRKLSDYLGGPATVIVFLGTECPVANLYVPTLLKLADEFSPQGVRFVGINANEQDSFLEVSAHAQEYELTFPVLKDFHGKAVKALGATRTPEAFVLDLQGRVQYRGRIDDQFEVANRRQTPTHQELRDAITDLVAGKSVRIANTEAVGCLIGRSEKRPNRNVTYAREVSRLLTVNCQACHRPGEVAPFSLLTYDDAKSWSGAIREAISEERMPPWHADPRYGEFSNHRGLDAHDRDTILTWIDLGCPLGDVNDIPPPRTFPEGWSIGTPDAVFTMPEEFEVPASGVVDYKRFAVDPGFTEDKWIQAAEARPGNRAVVHHILVYIQAKGQPLYDADGVAHTLAGWAPGDMPAVYPEGTARRVPAGSRLIFEVHYTPNGKAQPDRSSVGVIFAKAPPEREVEVNILANMGLRIPAGALRHPGEMTYEFKRDALVYSFMPHMHLRGTSARYEAIEPDGKRSVLLNVPDYDFGWQSIYRFKEPLRVSKGTRLVWSVTWDNSADNPRNPDATKDVSWGLQTWEEMQNGWMESVPVAGVD